MVSKSKNAETSAGKIDNQSRQTVRPPKTQRYPVFESDNDKMGFLIDSTAPGSPSVEAVGVEVGSS
ncbi:unnamed protein product [Brassica oleracea]|uniref:Uncharacterized protein n=1 Tax=Brassica oleracea TaxID=3712 RepID=A0A3P6C4E9_BRAOL|nr:unnamed protein product [Brassica oleracea]